MKSYLLSFILCLFFFWPQQLRAQGEVKNILYINSYNVGYPWTDEVTEGFKQVIDFNPNINYFAEFMDTKRFSRIVVFPSFYNYLDAKYDSSNFDLIVACDNDAVDFFLAHQDSVLFKNKPLIFCGITNIEEYPFKNIEAYGVVEGRNLQQIFHSMHRLFPQRRNVYAIFNETVSDSIYKSTVSKFMLDYESSDLKTVSSDNSDSIVRLLQSLGEEDIVYLFNRTFEKKGLFKPYRSILNHITPPYHVPVFSDMAINENTNNVLGGERNRGQGHGKLVAKMAIKRINGEEISPQFLYPKGELVYNYHQLRNFDVELSLLPRDAIIVNKPESIFYKFKRLILVNAFFIIACIAIILILIINNRNQKRYRNKLEAARDQALQSESVKTSFIANVSHEIRTPLNAIIGFSDIIKQENTNKEFDEYVNHIFESSQILERLVNDVLDLSLIDANEVKLNYDNIHLPDFMDELVKRNIVQIAHYQKPKLKLKHKLPKSGPENLYVDKFRLNQIIQNLINNAIKYSFTGTITLSYAFHSREEIKKLTELQTYDLKHQQYCLISVRDYGIGIPQELKSFVFERFRRLDQVYMGHHKGVGLGLNISKSLLNIMGGEIWFTSVQSKGSTFSFIIPHLPKP